MNVVNKVANFIKESYDELRQTQWPNRQQTVKLTVSLIAISAGMGLFISVFDYIFKQLLTIFVNR